MAHEKGKEAENAAEAFSGPLSLGNGIAKSLKPKPKIEKKSLVNNFTMGKKLVGSSQVQLKKSKKKKMNNVPEGPDKESKDNERGDEENLVASKIKKKGVGEKIEKELNRKPKENLGSSNLKDSHKHGIMEKSTSQKNKEKNDADREKLGGLIFMCSAKTKPDCYRYHVMGVTMSKKDLVLGVKPGLKLFLYDFDLKLLYGIYTASSSGGIKLEPKAFNGAFPVQVRFSVQEDCYPLPESVFKKAIKENYDERRKFDTELSVKQVKKLTQLFRPARIMLKAPAVHLPHMGKISWDEACEGGRESWSRQHREPVARDADAHDEVGRSLALPYENNQHLPYREVPLLEKEDTYRDLFLTEEEYRTYGLHRERSNLAPPKILVAPSEPKPRGHLSDNILRQQSSVYGDNVPPLGEVACYEHLLRNERDRQTDITRELQHPIPTTAHGSFSDSYLMLPDCSSQFVALSVHPYSAPSRREEVPLVSHSLGGRTYLTRANDLGGRDDHFIETDSSESRGGHVTETVRLGRRAHYHETGRIYSRYSSSALSGYDQMQPQAARPDPSLALVSSRYSFAGPSSSYR